MFLFKKLVSQFLMPFALSAILILVGLALLWFSKRRQTAGKIVATVGLALLLLSGYGRTSSLLLRPLERQYAALDLTTPLDPPPTLVVVLGSGHATDPSLPLSSQLDDTALVRLVEGIRVYTAHPGSKLVLTGGGYYDVTTHADMMAAMAQEMGVPHEDIITIGLPNDTAEEAYLVQPLVADAPFALVTSASHMPRAMAMFEKLGLDPIPAPTRHYVKDAPVVRFYPGSLFPQPKNLQKSTRAFYEYLGLLWGRIRGLL